MKYTLLDTFLLDGYYVTQNYMNNPTYYSQFGLKGHEGVDFGHKDKLKKVRTPISGTAFVAWDKAYGWYAVIENYKQRCGVYLCHMINPIVVSGEEVKAGDAIGEMDDTGNANGEHVHLNFIILDEKGSKKYNSKTYNYGYLDPRYPRDTGVPVSFPGVEEYTIDWVQKIDETTTTMPETIQITNEQFLSMRTKSDQVDALATYFKIDAKDLRAQYIIDQFEQLKRDKENANAELAKKQTLLEETQSQLRTEMETSKTRKETYDKLLEYLATNLGTIVDEAVIRGEFKELLSVEDKLRVANDTIEKINKEHEEEKKSLQTKIDKLNEDLSIKEEEIKDLKERVKTVQSDLDGIKEDEETVGTFNKLFEDAAAFFIRLRDRFKQQEKAYEEEKKKTEEEATDVKA